MILKHLVLLISQLDKVESILLLLLFKSLHCRIHVDCECDDDVQSDDDAEVVEDDEEVSVEQFTAHDVNAHLHDHVPIIDNDQDKKSDVGAHQVVEVDKGVIVGNGRVCNNLRRVSLYLATEDDHAHLGKAVENCHHHNDQVIQRAHQVLECLKDDSHDFNLIQKCQKFKHSDEHNNFKDFDRVVVLLEVIICTKVPDHCWQIKELAKSLRPNSEMITVSFDDP